MACIVLKFTLLLLCVLRVCSVFITYTPTIQISQGKLKGIRGLNGQNQYYGVPYATSERFQLPKLPKKWSGVFHATMKFGSCAQSAGGYQFGNEDCLSLDIYTPRNARKGKKIPVLIFFHGGAYYVGAKWQYDPEFLVKKNIIVVIPNYRLGVLGFLCISNVSNLGLKDQTAALIWVQNNIADVGGDPDSVTISGQSAGATSASFHILSERSQGLFKKAILVSGVALSPWAFNVDHLRPTLADASKISRAQNEVDVYNIFLRAPLHDLLNVTQGNIIDPKYFKYAPCGDMNFTDPFFHDTPYNIIKSKFFNKVPMIIGYTNLEGLSFYGLNNQNSLKDFDATFSDRLPSIFSWCSNKDKTRIAKIIRSHYFGNRKINNKVSIKDGIDMYSDWIAYGSIDAFSKLMAMYSNKPVYNYLFSYDGERNFFKSGLNPGIELQGAAHIDDLWYLFKPLGLTLGVNKDDALLIDRFTTMLTNFMKYGDPTPSESPLVLMRWPAITANRSRVMRIDNPLSVSDTPLSVRGEFYLRLMCQHGLSGYVPCESAMQCNRD